MLEKGAVVLLGRGLRGRVGWCVVGVVIVDSEPVTVIISDRVGTVLAKVVWSIERPCMLD